MGEAEVTAAAAAGRFVRADGRRREEPSPNLYVANCGPAVGLSMADIAAAFSPFGEVLHVRLADDTGTRVIVSFADSDSAEAALLALHARPCPALRERLLHIRFSFPLPSLVGVPKNDLAFVCSNASELGIPGVYLLLDFVSLEEEQELLASVDSRPWLCLAKRRVQHYGYEFVYQTRNVNTQHFLGQLPSFVSFVLDRHILFKDGGFSQLTASDQLTVNEYPAGVGLSPHIDTHSAFEDSIFSLSLAGSCVMEFRKYSHGTWLPPLMSTNEAREDINIHGHSSFIRRAIFLPPRSMLLMSGEARYAWHHYIPHHKVDLVDNQEIRRNSRRVSFTFRKVRFGRCCCSYPQYCDSEHDEVKCDKTKT